MNAVAEETGSGSTAIRPFSVNVPDAELTDLRRRIHATKWPERETVTDASQGVQLATTQKLARYWTEYDWRKCEAKLNALPQFITEIDGLDIHFIHVRSKHENALPLVVTHGWPGSIIEFLKIVDPLTNPTAHGASASDAFHLVIPSIPGFGFSGKPAITDHRCDGYAGASGIARHPPQLGFRGSTRHKRGSLYGPARAGGSLSRRKTGVRAAGRFLQDRRGLRPRDGEPSADTLRIRGFTRRPGSLPN
jgi:hypothetical protein